MTQQPGGWPAPAPQQNQQFPSSQGWPAQGGQQAPQQQAVQAPRSAEEMFEGVGGAGVPSFKWNGQIGDQIVGEIVDQYATHVTDTAGNPKLYPKTGELIPQLNVTLQTSLRNWDRVNPEKIPVDDNGHPKMPSEDDGRRRVYIKYDMRTAVAKALQAAQAPPGGLRNGGMLAIQLKGFKPTAQSNPLPLYEARYKAPAPATDFDFGTVSEAPQQGHQQVATPVQQQQAPAPQPQQAPPADPWVSTPQQAAPGPNWASAGQPAPSDQYQDDPPF